ncbi:NAD-dependent epimerase/dehydratase family protein [Psychrobacter lutiphocae]|uniref:NAD-dependent epimerase/dehydratase family protein n=1 Tax=Psychrobacter lutiphocae TaxID=540500 RepID=UPI0003724B70|nr:NAD-dependent epimerase/dehydratase family protein [Psychrobacter lutiphocae]
MSASESFNPLIIGQGAIGLAVTNTLANKSAQVTGLARGERSQYALVDSAYFIQADARQLTAKQIDSFTHIAIIVTPDKASSSGRYQATDYQQTYLGIAEHIAKLADNLPKLERIVFISSTGVYGQDNGEWIDETILPKTPKRKSSGYILQAEQVLQSAYAERAIIIRPSGIYGTQRLMRIRKASEDNKTPMPKYGWSNRIMDSDLVNIIVQVLTLPQSQLKPIYLATDYAPVTSFELTTWLADKLNSEAPKLIGEEQLHLSQATDSAGHKKLARHSMSGKRLHSNIPRAWLQYPDWQAGYAYILRQQDLLHKS